PNGVTSDPVLADLPSDVFAPPSVKAGTLAVWEKFVTMPDAVFTEPISALAGPSVGVPPSPVVLPIPGVGTVVFRARHARVAAAVLHANVAVGSPSAGCEVVLVDLPRDVFATPTELVAPKTVPSHHASVDTQLRPARVGDAIDLTRKAVCAW